MAGIVARCPAIAKRLSARRCELRERLRPDLEIAVDALIAALLTWVVALGKPGAATALQPAEIVRTLVARAPEDHPAAPDAAPVAGRDGRINALYAATDQPRLTICAIAADLVEGSDAFEDARDNPLWREILLHKLVHHTQWQAGEAVCSA